MLILGIKGLIVSSSMYIKQNNVLSIETAGNLFPHRGPAISTRDTWKPTPK